MCDGFHLTVWPSVVSSDKSPSITWCHLLNTWTDVCVCVFTDPETDTDLVNVYTPDTPILTVRDWLLLHLYMWSCSSNVMSVTPVVKYEYQFLCSQVKYKETQNTDFLLQAYWRSAQHHYVWCFHFKKSFITEHCTVDSVTHILHTGFHFFEDPCFFTQSSSPVYVPEQIPHHY